MIHITLGFNNNYAKFAGTTMVSIFENHPCPPRTITMHCFHDNTLTLDSYEKLVYLVGQYNQIVKFYNVERMFPSELKKFHDIFSSKAIKKFSILSAFRLIIGKIIPKDVPKIIYLDSDIIVNLDINELWQIELSDKPLAAVPEQDNPAICAQFPICKEGLVKPENYFNSGVMVMNLEKLRSSETKTMSGTEFIASKKYDKDNLLNQNIFNYCFSNEAIKLPRKFNCWVREQQRFSNTPIERKIYHYIGQGKSLGLDKRDQFNRLYWHYFSKTPWFNESTIGNFYDGVRQLYVEDRHLMTIVSAAVSGKRRAFVTAPQNIDALKKVFYVQEGEDIFQINSPSWLNELIKVMKESVDKKIYFMLTGKFIYPQIRSMLIQAGFVEWKDFLNGEIFLSEVHGVHLNSYPIIERM